MTMQRELILVSALFVTACATVDAPTLPLQEARSAVRAAESDSAVLSSAPLELKRATESLDRANRALKEGEPNAEVDHHAYLATRRAQTAVAVATAKTSETAIKEAEVDRERTRADVRTLEAQTARTDATMQRAHAAIALQQASMAQQQAAAAQQQASASQQQAMAARQQAETAAREAAAAQAQATNSRAQAANSQAQAAAMQNEAALSRSQAAAMQNEAALSRSQAAAMQNEAALSRSQAEAAAARTAELQRKLAELEAQRTERGRVVTLGDVLFEFDRADVKPVAQVQLGRLAEFLRQYPDRRVSIEGYTDNVGSAAYNDQLSYRRAESIRTQLALLGVSSDRMAAVGYGKEFPVASNTTDTNRALNRRVEVIISDNDQPVRPRAMTAPGRMAGG